MINDIKKSVNSILYERTSSPLFGTFIVSWAIWNWKIIYLTIFIPTDKISANKIDLIVEKYSTFEYLITYPAVSTIFFLTIIPFVSNGAYWLSLKFDKWKKDQKNKINLNQLISLEQSIELREQILNQESRFEKLIENKNLEINQLKSLLEKYQNQSEPENSANYQKDDNDELIELSNRIKANPKELQSYERIIELIQRGYSITGVETISPKTISLLSSYNIIEQINNAKYKITEKGYRLIKLMLN